MKKLLLALFLFVSYSTVNAQFSENFDGAPTPMISSGPGTWTIDNTLSTSIPNSYRGQYGPNQYVAVETPPNSINATGNAFVAFSFKQICKIEFVDSAKIEVSVDGGNTWVRLYDQGFGNQNCRYLGGSSSFANRKSFCESSYGLDWVPGTDTVPNNSWWKTETFDISLIAAFQPDIRIRWKSLDAANVGISTRYGWLIDDISVQINPCEIDPPTFGAITPFLTGNIFGTGTPLPSTVITIDISDVSGVPQGNAFLNWTVNSGTPVNQELFDQNGSGFGPYLGEISRDGFGTSFADLDTVCWWIDATDGSGCNNASTFPSVGQTTCFIVNSSIRFPYCDGFDNATSLWHPDSANSVVNYWELGTPSNGALNTANSAPNVWAIGLSIPYGNNAISYLNSPLFDFSATPVANMSFYINYDVEGSLTFNQYDGTHVEYTLDGSQANPVWQDLGILNDPNGKNWYNGADITQLGHPGWNTTSNGWVRSSYKLGFVPSLGGSTTPIQFRFVFTSDVTQSRSGFLLDDFCIIVPPKNDIGVVAYVQPVVGAGQPAGTSIPLSISVENFGLLAQNSYNIGYSINGVPASVPFTTNLPINSVTTLALPNFVVPSGAFTICTWTDLSGDGDHTNDTLCTTLIGVPTKIPTYCDDFETGNIGWLPINLGTTVASQNTNWELGTPAFNSTTGAHSGTNAWDINLNSIYTADAIDELYTPYFDFTTTTNAQLSFWINYNTDAGADGVRMDYTTNSGGTWNTLGTGSTTAPDPCGKNWYTNATLFNTNKNAWSGNSNGWVKCDYKLCCANGVIGAASLVQFRFVFTSDGFGAADGFSLDDFCVTATVGDDAGVSAILTPVPGGFPVGVQAHVSVKIENFGSSVLTSIPVSYTAAGITHTFTYTGSIPPCGSATFVFPDSIGIVQGPNDICAFTGLTLDLNHSNDTTCITLVGQPILPLTYSTPYSDNFESGNIGYAPEIGTLGDPGTIWEFGYPNYNIGTGAHSPNTAWDVNLLTSSTNNALTYLTTPYFKLKGKARSEHARLKFWQNRAMGTFGDQFYIQYKKGATGGTWTKLGFQGDPKGTNWYNTADNWDDNSNAWRQSTYVDFDKVLTSGSDSIIQFRFVYSTTGFSNSEGVSIDDVELSVPFPLSVTPVSVNLSNPNSLILPGQQITFASPIKNNGYASVFIHNATLTIDGVVVASDLINYSPSLLMSDSIVVHNFNTTWTATPGFHKACVYTDNPNLSQDYSLADDTICRTILVFDSVTTTALPYCNDFESGTQWVTLDAISYSQATSFQLGSPNQAFLNNAHSGQKAWTLYTDSNYVNQDSSGLFSSMLRVQTGHCYKLSFWQEFRTEFGSDGGTVEYSDDLGVTWKRIDFSGTPGIISTGGIGTNYSYVVSLDPNDPSKKGFTGAVNNWFKTQQTLRPNFDGLIIIRWRFASDYSARDEGWSIDDVCFTDLGICTPIGINEFAIDDFGLSQNYPNPTNGNTTIEYAIPTNGVVTIQVTDIVGQVVDVIVSGNETAGKHVVDYNTEKLAPGIYTYTMKFDGRQITKRIVITE